MKPVRDYTLIALLALGLLSACATPGPDVAPEAVSQSQRILLAEIARSRGDVDNALRWYLEAAPVSESVSLLREASQYSLRARAWPEAVTLTRRWVYLAPESAEAHWHRGRAELLGGELSAAENAYSRWLALGEGEDWWSLSRALQSEPRQWRAWQLMQRLARRHEAPGADVALARLAMSLERLGDAEYHARRALRKQPDNEVAHWLVLRARAGRGEPDALAAGALRAAEGDISDLLDWVTLLWEVDRLPEARAAVDQGLERLGNEPALRYTRALLSIHLGEGAYARDDLRHLMSRGFRVRESWYQMGQSHLQGGEYNQALNWFDRVLSGEDELDARVAGIIMLLRLGEEEEAQERITLLDEQYREGRYEFRLKLAAALAREGRGEQAWALCETLLASREQDAEAWYRCALALLQADPQDARGIDWLRRAHALWPEEPAMLNALGYSLADQNRELREARRLIRRALERSPDSGAIQDSMGWVEYRLGNTGRARDWLERAWRRLPSSEIAAHLIEVRWVQGDYEAATRLHEQAESRWPDDELLRNTWQRLQQD